MDTKLPKDSDANYDESREEAKHPGALLGLIMGIYPAILVIGLLLVVSIVGVRSMFPSTYPPPTMPENETVQQAVQFREQQIAPPVGACGSSGNRRIVTEYKLTFS
jgi:hypothetical protein